MTDLDIVFNAYLYQSGKTKTALAEHLCMTRQNLNRMFKRGVNTWQWQEVIKAAHYLGIPVDVLREQVSYRKEKT